MDISTKIQVNTGGHDVQTKMRSMHSFQRLIRIQWSCRCSRASSFSSNFVAVGLDLAVAPVIDSVYNLDSTGDMMSIEMLIML